MDDLVIITTSYGMFMGKVKENKDFSLVVQDCCNLIPTNFQNGIGGVRVIRHGEGDSTFKGSMNIRSLTEKENDLLRAYEDVFSTSMDLSTEVPVSGLYAGQAGEA